ncbi:MAG: PQQ-binding-like beta-propeller repeat protein [Phycisphaerae bacterium]
MTTPPDIPALPAASKPADGQSPAPRPTTAPPIWYRPALVVAIGSGVLTLAVAAVLLWDTVSTLRADPLASKDMEAMMTAVRKKENRSNEALKAEIRKRDLELRTIYFQRQSQATRGGWALLFCGGLFVISARLAAHGRRKGPHPAHVADRNGQIAAGRIGRAAVTAVGIIVVGSAVALGIMTRQSPPPASILGPTPSPWPEVTPAPPPQVANAADFARNWHRFRGPGGLGVSPFANVPVEWDGRKKKNILWKKPVPLEGENSPVVWGDRVFLAGANKDTREVYCYFALDGRLLWQTSVKDVPNSQPTPDAEGITAGYAAPTVCCDGPRVFAIFSNMDLVCLSAADGRILWSKSLGAFSNAYGMGSSPILAGGYLVIQLDQGQKDDTDKSKLIALDPANGDPIWQTTRPGGQSWATPILVDYPTGPSAPKGGQIITNGLPWANGYCADDGQELWRADVMAGDVTPSPAFADGQAFVVNSEANLNAIDAGGLGMEMATRILWTPREEESVPLPDIPSPVGDEKGKLLFLLKTSGELSCLDIADKGKLLWQKSLRGEFNASPSLVGDRLYLLAKDGTMYVVAAGREYKLIATSPLGEESLGTPAFADGKIFIRGKRNLYCIAAGK